MKTMTLTSKLMLTALTSVLAVACTFKKVDRQEHEGKQSTDLTIPEAAGSQTAERSLSNQEMATKIKAFDLQSIYTKTMAIKTEVEALGVIEALESNMIRREVWSSPQVKNDDKVVTALSYYNYSVIKLLEIAPNSEKAMALSDRYKAMALEGCSGELENCLNIKWLKADARSQRVIELLAQSMDKQLDAACKEKCDDQIKKFYDILAIGMSVSNAQKNLVLQALYLKRANEFGNIYAGQNDLEKKEALLRHGQIFENILSKFEIEKQSDDLMYAVQQFKPWTFSKVEKNAFPFGVEKIFAFAAKHMMYDKDGKTLSKDFKDAIEASQSPKDKDGKDSADLSFRQKLKKIVSEDTSRLVFKNLQFEAEANKAQSASFYNEYFFMIDRLYKGHLGLEEVGNIWKGSNKNEKLLVETLSIYAKTELIHMIIKTNEYFRGIISRENMTSERLFKKTIEESQPLTQVWDQMFTRLDRIATFAGQQMRDSNLGKSDSQLTKVKDLISVFRRDTKLTSVYPGMLLLGHFMIVTNAKFEYETWWGAKIQIDPEVIVKYMLNGSFDQPWFLFSGDTAPLNKAEIVNAFYYTLNAGAFETFSGIKDEKGSAVLDRVSFLKNSLKRLMAEKMREVESTTESMRTVRTENAGKISDILGYCHKILGTKNSAPNLNFSVTVPMAELPKYALFGGKSKGSIETVAKYYNDVASYYGYSEGDNVENVFRTKFQTELTQLKAMMVPLEASITSLSIDETAKKQMLKELNTEMGEAEAQLAEYLRTGIGLYREIDGCDEALLSLERKRQMELIQSEIAYLGNIWDSMMKIHSADAAQKTALIQELKKGMSETERIDGDSYIFSQLDILNRLAGYSSKLSPKLIVTAPDELDTKRMAAILRNVTFISNSSGKPLTKEQFIRNALSTLMTQGGSEALAWFNDVISTDLYDSKMKALVTLYRMGFDLGLDGKEIKNVTAKELIDLGIRRAKFAGIKEEEIPVLKLLGLSEYVKKINFVGMLFDSTETRSFGILDAVYYQVTRIEEDLIEAKNYYLQSSNISNDKLVFPIPFEITQKIKSQYSSIVKRSEKIVTDFEAALTEAEKNIDPQSLNIAYRIDGDRVLVYSSTDVDGGFSKLVKNTKRKEVGARIRYFHADQTFGFYKEKEAVK